MLLSTLASYGQTDSLVYGNRQFYTSLQFGQFIKTHSVSDSFSYSSGSIQADAGILLRQSKILRPYISAGLSYNSHLLGTYFYDSSLINYSPSVIRNFNIQPQIGVEISPEDQWYFRVGLQFPILLSYRTQNEFFLHRFGLMEGSDLKLQKKDIRLNVEVGRMLFQQRLGIHGALIWGSESIFSVNTPDLAGIIGINIGLRYHFGRL